MLHMFAWNFLSYRVFKMTIVDMATLWAITLRNSRDLLIRKIIQLAKASARQLNWGRVTHICVSTLASIGSYNDCSAPSHYLNQGWVTVNWTLVNIFQWHLNQNTTMFIEETACKNVAAKLWPSCLGLNVLICDMILRNYVRCKDKNQ